MAFVILLQKFVVLTCIQLKMLNSYIFLPPQYPLISLLYRITCNALIISDFHILLFILLTCCFTTSNAKINVSCWASSPTTNSYTVLATWTADSRPTTFPYVISIPAPTETVLGVSGPQNPIINWDIQDGMLNIYLTKRDFLLIEGLNDYHLSVATNPDMHYVIIFDCPWNV